MKKTETWTLQYLQVLTTQKGLKVIHVKLNRNCTPHGQKYVDTTFPMLWCSSSCFLFCCTPWVQWGEVLYNQVLYVSHLQNVISLKTSQLCFFHTGLKPGTLEWKFFWLILTRTLWLIILRHLTSSASWGRGLTKYINMGYNKMPIINLYGCFSGEHGLDTSVFPSVVSRGWVYVSVLLRFS